MSVFAQYQPIPIEELLPSIRKFPGLSLNQKKDFLGNLIKVHELLSFNIERQAAYFRVRNIGSNQITSVYDVLWPRVAHVGNRFGSMCYIANTDMTAMAETEHERKLAGMSQKVAMVRLRIKKPFRLCPIGELDQIIRSGHGNMTFGEDATKIFELINEYLLKDYHAAQSFMLQDSFLFEQMSSHDRELTAFTSQTIIQKNSSFDGIGYPSLKLRGGFNLAVRQDGFWDHWEICGISKLHVECLHLGYYDFYPLEHVSRIDPDGTLHWISDEDPDKKQWLQIPAFTLTAP